MALTTCRECSKEVSTSAETCPHCGVPDPSGRTITTGNCGGCGEEIAVAPQETCPRCGVRDPLMPYQEFLARRLQREQPHRNAHFTLALGAASAMFVGVFLPIVSVPFAGTLNYFQNGRGDGVVIIALAATAAFLAMTGKTKWVWLPGLGAAAMLAYTFVNLRRTLAGIRREFDRDMAGNPFRGLGDAALEAVQLQWGWAVLALGTMLLIAIGLMAHAADT